MSYNKQNSISKKENSKELSKEILESFRKLDISSIVLKETGELIDLDFTETDEVFLRKTKKKFHKNRFGYIDPTVSGIDIGSKLIHVSIPSTDQNVILKEYETDTMSLRQISKELKEAGVKTAVMEATGVYWIPLFEILEADGFQAILVDAKSVKNAPARKTDMLDCQWIQTLYSAGLLTPAFRPPKDRIPLRSLIRHRQNLIKSKQTEILHMEKALQLMNLKLSTALSDINSITGNEIIRAIVGGEKDPEVLAQLRNARCKKPTERFVAALTGNYQREHLFALKHALELFDFIITKIEECDIEIMKELEKLPDLTDKAPPLREKDKKKNGQYANSRKPKKNDFKFDLRSLLWKKSGVDVAALSGISDGTALLIFAELGGSVTSWENSKRFASWLKLCPGNNISGGKSRKSRQQPCANYITQALRMSALSAKGTSSAVGAHIRRISGRSDKAKGIKAGAHKLAIHIYNMYKNGWAFHETGADSYEKAYQERVLIAMRNRAKRLGYTLVKRTAL